MVVLHGGSTRGHHPVVSATQPSVLRMIPVARRIDRGGRGRLAVVRLLNTFRGWDPERSPVDDAGWAIDRLGEQYGDLPVALVGHSLGGRAALLAGDAEPVTCVVALNPWVYATDGADLSGRRVLIVHGSDDEVASPTRARVVAERIGRRADVRFELIQGGRHAMLRHAAAYEKAAADFVSDTLLEGSSPRG